MSDSERFNINNIDDNNNNFLNVDQIYLNNESSIKIDSSKNKNTTAEFFFGKNIQIRGLHLLICKINRPYNNKDFQTLIKTKGHDSINDIGDVILNPLHISTYLWTTKERFAQEHLENIKYLYLKIKTNNIEITPFITHFHQIIECFKYIENEILKFRYLEIKSTLQLSLSMRNHVQSTIIINDNNNKNGSNNNIIDNNKHNDNNNNYIMVFNPKAAWKIAIRAVILIVKQHGIRKARFRSFVERLSLRRQYLSIYRRLLASKINYINNIDELFVFDDDLSKQHQQHQEQSSSSSSVSPSIMSNNNIKQKITSSSSSSSSPSIDIQSNPYYTKYGLTSSLLHHFDDISYLFSIDKLVMFRAKIIKEFQQKGFSKIFLKKTLISKTRQYRFWNEKMNNYDGVSGGNSSVKSRDWLSYLSFPLLSSQNNNVDNQNSNNFNNSDKIGEEMMESETSNLLSNSFSIQCSIQISRIAVILFDDCFIDPSSPQQQSSRPQNIVSSPSAAVARGRSQSITSRNKNNIESTFINDNNNTNTTTTIITNRRSKVYHSSKPQEISKSASKRQTTLFTSTNEIGTTSATAIDSTKILDSNNNKNLYTSKTKAAGSDQNDHHNNHHHHKQSLSLIMYSIQSTVILLNDKNDKDTDNNDKIFRFQLGVLKCFGYNGIEIISFGTHPDKWIDQSHQDHQQVHQYSDAALNIAITLCSTKLFNHQSNNDIIPNNRNKHDKCNDIRKSNFKRKDRANKSINNNNVIIVGRDGDRSISESSPSSSDDDDDDDDDDVIEVISVDSDDSDNDNNNNIRPKLINHNTIIRNNKLSSLQEIDEKYGQKSFTKVQINSFLVGDKGKNSRGRLTIEINFNLLNILWHKDSCLFITEFIQSLQMNNNNNNDNKNDHNRINNSSSNPYSYLKRKVASLSIYHCNNFYVVNDDNHNSDKKKKNYPLEISILGLSKGLKLSIPIESTRSTDSIDVVDNHSDNDNHFDKAKRNTCSEHSVPSSSSSSSLYQHIVNNHLQLNIKSITFESGQFLKHKDSNEDDKYDDDDGKGKGDLSTLDSQNMHAIFNYYTILCYFILYYTTLYYLYFL